MAVGLYRWVNTNDYQVIAKNPDYYDTYISMSGTASSYGNVDLNNSFKNSSTNFVVFVPTKDISIESFRQYESWKDSGFNVDYYYAPTDNVSSENKGINKYQNNIDVVYNQISDKFPEKISLLNNDKKWVSLDKQSWDSIRTDNISSAKVVFVENGGHSDPIGFLSDDEFYIWLNNFV